MQALKTRFLVYACVFACLLAGAAACGGSDEKPASETATPSSSLPPPAVDRSANPLKVVVSMPVFADMARIIGGNQVTVTTLIPPGADPRTYVPSDDMAQAVAEANAVFYNGLGLDGATERFIQAHLASHPPLVIEIADNVPSPSVTQPPDRAIYATDAGDDPHLFLDPALAPWYAETISHSLIIEDGANTSYYDARYQAYKAQLLTLDGAIAQKMSAIPDANKSLLVTHHNSLIWFAKRYGLAVAGTLEDDGRDGLAQKIAGEHPPAVFTETGFDTSALTELANQAGVKICNIDTDTFVDGNTTYLQMMQKTADTIAECLK